MFGKWPIQPFLELPKAMQAEFWRADAKSKVAMQALLTSEISRVRETVEIDSKIGQYFPLSVYEAKGYKQEMLDNIQTNCPAEYDSTLNCQTYMLTVRGVLTNEITKEVTNTLMNLRDTSLRGYLSHYCSPISTKRNRGKKRDRSSSSDSSKSSSSKSRRTVTPELTMKQKRANLLAAKKQTALEKAAKAKADKAIIEAGKKEQIARMRMAANEAKEAAKAQKKIDQKDQTPSLRSQEAVTTAIGSDLPWKLIVVIHVYTGSMINNMCRTCDMTFPWTIRTFR